MLVALLNVACQAASDYHANLLGNALRAGGKSDPPMPRSFTSQEWSEERATARSIRPEIVLPPSVYPKLVRFVDMDNSASVRAVDSRNLSRSEEHTSELQSLMRISYAVFCLKKKQHNKN